MDKRQPLSVMIALQSKKMKGGSDGEKPGDAPNDAEPDDDADEGMDGKYDDPGLISACEDAIDAMKNRDAKALSAAWGHYLEIRESLGDEDERN
jgi:hypothetical protein